MACRIGMSSNPAERINHWQRECSGMFESKILARNLTYDDAQRLEASKARECGPYCKQEFGGVRKTGRVYSVYRVDCY